MVYFPFPTVIVFLLLFICQGSFGLTMRALQNLPTNEDPHFYFPEEDEVEGRAAQGDKTFVRNIGTVAGRQIVPRRWGNDQAKPRSRFIIDENSLAIQARKNPLLAQLMRRPNGNK